MAQRLEAWPLGLLLIAFLLGRPVLAAEPRQDVEVCLQRAAALHHVDLRLLRAIAKVESSFNPGATNHNTNGTGDTGLMQINDSWLPTLAKFGIKKADLYDPCTSAYVGAWILAHNIRDHGMTWRAVGSYNSPRSVNQQVYAEKINRALAEQP